MHQNALHRWATGTKKTAFGERRLILTTKEGNALFGGVVLAQAWAEHL